jgi:hypothetical protein
MSKERGEGLQLAVAMSLEMIGSNSAYNALILEGVDPEEAKNLLSLEAFLRHDLSIIGPATPVSVQLYGISKNFEMSMHLVELFYSLLSCQELAENIELSPEDIVEAFEKSSEIHGVEEIIKFPDLITKSLPDLHSQIADIIECFSGYGNNRGNRKTDSDFSWVEGKTILKRAGIKEKACY